MKILTQAVGGTKLLTKFKSNENRQLQNQSLQTNPLQQDLFVKKKRELNFTAAKPDALIEEAVEMSRYIKIGAYDQLEKYHAGWEKATDTIAQIVSKRFKEPVIFEHGPGTGNSTAKFASQIPNSKIYAVELDKECYDHLLLNMQGYPNVIPIHGSSLDYLPPEQCDVVVGNFSLTHLDEYLMKEFLDICSGKILKRNGNSWVVVGEETLLPFNPNNPDSHLTALGKHHFNIMLDALRQGKPELSDLEYEALKSGWRKEGDFKVPGEVLKKRMENAGFEVVKEIKIYPRRSDFALSREPNMGVYVYAAKLKL